MDRKFFDHIQEQKTMNRTTAFATFAMLTSLIGCAAVSRSLNPKAPCADEAAAIEAASGRAVGPGEVRVSLADPPDRAKARTLDAMLTEGLSVMSSPGGIIEAMTQETIGSTILTGREGTVVTVRARAVITPDGEGSTVHLYADRTGENRAGKATVRVDGCSNDPSGAMWLSLLRVGRALQPDSAKRWVARPAL